MLVMGSSFWKTTAFCGTSPSVGEGRVATGMEGPEIAA